MSTLRRLPVGTLVRPQLAHRHKLRRAPAARERAHRDPEARLRRAIKQVVRRLAHLKVAREELADALAERHGATTVSDETMYRRTW